MADQPSVYVVEDDPIILAGYKVMLQNAGYRIAGEAYDGQTAAEQVPHILPDVVMMDVNLPVMDGLASISRIREQCGVPCVVITGYHDQERVSRALEMGVYGYLQKPIDENNIRVALQLALKRYHGEKLLEQEAQKAKQALENRKLIERAKGILMDRFGIPEEQAMRTLQKKSRDKNKKLVEIADEIIRASELL